MDLICIDKSKCKKDKLCIIDCPFSILRKGEDGFPKPTEDAGKYCIECGHCVAICPESTVFPDLGDIIKLQPYSGSASDFRHYRYGIGDLCGTGNGR